MLASPENPMLVKALRKVDVVTGTLNIRQKDVKCLVIGEVWPTWLSTARALAGLDNVISYCGLSGLTEKLGSVLLDWRDHSAQQKVVSEWSSYDVVFVSGRWSFIEMWERLGCQLDISVVAIEEGTRRVRRPSPPAQALMSWKQASHVECGGATSARTWLGVGRGLKETGTPVLEGRARRCLLDYLNPTIWGRPTELLEEQLGAARETKVNRVCRAVDGTIESQGLLAVDKPTDWVLSPCVFAKSQWARRKLTVEELVQLWDLPVEWKGKFDGLSVEQLPFLGAAPAKILWEAASHLEIFGMVHTGQEDGETVEIKRGYGWIDQDAVAELAKINEKAVKHDDAEVDPGIWNDFALRRSGLHRSPRVDAVLDLARGWLLTRWLSNLRCSLCGYLRQEYGLEWWICDLTECKLDREMGLDALLRSSRATWWEWTDGSTLYFWRWPKEFRLDARDGMKIKVTGDFPRYRERPRTPKNLEQVDAKVLKVIERRYITDGWIQSLLNWFDVVKGLTDIRMVYDGTKSGLNASVWAPGFSMPTVDSALDHVCASTKMSDSDLGEFFLNFALDPVIRPYAGLDLSPLPSCTGNWKRWNRMLMGFKPSPYVAIRMRLIAEDVVRGDHLDPTNPFHWTEVILNLPGKESYDPTMPWVYRVKMVDGEPVMASNHVSFTDDVRGMGSSEDACWNVTRRVAQILQWFGIQDAARKRRGPSQTPGAWAGAVIRVIEEGVGVTVTQEKWERVKAIIGRWLLELQEKCDALHRKDLESDRGFLVYVARTFPVMKSYLKGFHLTLESWRPDRDEDGWKRTDEVLVDSDGNLLNMEDNPSAPKLVIAVPRFKDDLKALADLTANDRAPLRIVRPRLRLWVRYGFGDSSGAGFGATVTTSTGIRVRFGVWGKDEGVRSSNYRELRNLVEALEDLWEKGELLGVEIFIFTDNSVAELAYYKGTSSSKLLFELVLRLKKLEMAAGAKIHFIHCAGTRQIAQGADGLSRGDLTEGVMAGTDMLAFVPIHLSAFALAPADLLQWIRLWAGAPELEPLAPAEWYTLGHDIAGGNVGSEGIWFPSYEAGIRLWAPPPSAARPVVEQLREARHKHQKSTHLFVCSRVMCYEWRKQLLKDADFVCYLPAGALACWPKKMHEPLLIAVCLPFIRHAPWRLQRTPRILAMEREVRGMLNGDIRDPGPVLRKLCQLPRKLDQMPPKLVRQVLFYEKRAGLPD